MCLSVQPKDQQLTTISFVEFESVSEAFVFLTSQLKLILTNADFSNLQRSCIEQMNTPSGVQLTPEITAKVKSCENITKLFEVLADSPYWSWIDVRLLKVMAAASGFVEAFQLLSSYKKTIFSKKLFDIIPNAPSKEIKEKYYTKIVAKVNKNPNEITVADLIEFQSQLEMVLLDIKKGICTLEHLEKGCIEIHWHIPSDCVDRAYQAARATCYRFNDFHLQYLKIGHYPVIRNPLTSPEIVRSVPPSLVHVGEL